MSAGGKGAHTRLYVRLYMLPNLYMCLCSQAHMCALLCSQTGMCSQTHICTCMCARMCAFPPMDYICHRHHPPGLGKAPGSLRGCCTPPLFDRKAAPPRLTGPLTMQIMTQACVLAVGPYSNSFKLSYTQFVFDLNFVQPLGTKKFAYTTNNWTACAPKLVSTLSYVLQNSYVRLSVLPNSYVCFYVRLSVPPNTYVLPNSYVHPLAHFLPQAS